MSCPNSHQHLKPGRLHWALLADQYRRGGHKSNKGIAEPQNTNGRAQELREGDVRKDTGGFPVWSKGVDGDKYPKQVASRNKICAAGDTIETGMGDTRRVWVECKSGHISRNFPIGRQMSNAEEETDMQRNDEAVQANDGAIDEYATMYATGKGIPAIPASRAAYNSSAPSRPLDIEMFDPTYIGVPICEIREAAGDWVDIQETPARCRFGDKR